MIKKHKKLIWMALGMCILFAILLMQGSSKTDKIEEKNEKIAQKEAIQNAKTCYITRVQSDKVSETENILEDVKYFDYSVTSGNKIEGNIWYVPAGVEAEVGTFVGVLQDGYMNVVFITEKEGETYKEQKIFRVYDGLIIEAEEAEKQEVGGVQMYNDLTSIAFGNDGIFSEVNCGSIDKREVGLE